MLLPLQIQDEMQSAVTIKCALNRFVHKGITHGYRFRSVKEELQIVKFKYKNIHYYQTNIWSYVTECILCKNMSSPFTIKKLIKKRLITLDNITRNYEHIFFRAEFDHSLKIYSTYIPALNTDRYVYWRQLHMFYNT